MIIIFIVFTLCINILSVIGEASSDIEDCQKINNFFNKYKTVDGNELNIPECCVPTENTHFIKCDNGYVTDIGLSFPLNSVTDIDFSDFPVLSQLNSLLIEGNVYKDNILPSNFFNNPKLQKLAIERSNISTISDSIDSNCSLIEFSLYNGKLVEFPKSILNCSKLQKLDLTYNSNMKVIPSSISSLKDLKYLAVGYTGLTKLPNEIFKLNLNFFDIDGNSNLKTDIFRFNKPVERCDFRDTSITCYEKGSCLSFMVHEEPDEFVDESQYKNVIKFSDSCSSQSREIDDNLVNDDTNINYKKYIIILCLILVILILIVIFLYLYIKRYKMKRKEMEDDLYISVLSKSLDNIEIGKITEEEKITVESLKSTENILKDLKKVESSANHSPSIKSASSIQQIEEKLRTSMQSETMKPASSLPTSANTPPSSLTQISVNSSIISNRLDTNVNPDDSIVIATAIPSDPVINTPSMISSNISEKHSSLSSSIQNSSNSIHNTIPITSPDEKLLPAKCEDITSTTLDNNYNDDSLKVDLPPYSETAQNFVIYNPILVQYQLPQAVQNNYSIIGYNNDQSQRIIINNPTIITHASSSSINNPSVQAPIQKCTSQSLQNSSQNYKKHRLSSHSSHHRSLIGNGTNGPIFYNNKLINNDFIYGPK